MATNTLTGGKFQDLSGAPLASGTLVLQLSGDASAGLTIGEVGGGKKYTITLDSNGSIASSPTVWPNDTLLPLGTYYIASAYSSAGQLVWGPQIVTIASSPTPYDVSAWVPNNTPTAVIPSSLVFSGSLTAATITAQNNLYAKVFEGIRMANEFSGGTSALKITAAVSDAGTNGAVFATPGMATGDPSTIANNATVYDFRSGAINLKASGLTSSNVYTILGFSENSISPFHNFGALNIFQDLVPAVRPDTGLQGADLVLTTQPGSMDVRLRPVPIQQYSTTALTGGSGAQTILVPSTSGYFSSALAQASLILDRFTAGEETIPYGSWSIVDGTHLSVTPVKNHPTSPFTSYSVDQYGSVNFHGWTLKWQMTDGTAAGDNTTPMWHMDQIRSGNTDKGFVWYGNTGYMMYRWNLDGNHVPEWFGDSSHGMHFVSSNGGTGTSPNVTFYDNYPDLNVLLTVGSTGIISKAGVLGNVAIGTTVTPNRIQPGNTEQNLVINCQSAGTLYFNFDQPTRSINMMNGKVTIDGSGNITAAGQIKTATLALTALVASNTAPTISSGFGTSPSITANNGTMAFRINVGTGGTASSGVIGLPTATNGWNCFVQDVTNPGANFTKVSATSTNSVTVTNYNSAGTPTAWTASDVLQVSCFAY